MSVLASAIDQPLTLVQGATAEFSWIFQDIHGQPWDYTNSTAKIEFRKKPGASGTPILTASTVNGYITFPGLGELRVIIPFDVITALTFSGDTIEYWWDLEITDTIDTPNRVIKPFLPSTVTIYKEVTK